MADLVASTASTHDCFHSVASSAAPKESEQREAAHAGPESAPPESQEEGAARLVSAELFLLIMLSCQE